MPEDLAGKVAELQRYDFLSPQAEGRFEALLEQARDAAGQPDVRADERRRCSRCRPRRSARMKDMMAALNEMLERHQRGEDPRFDEFMAQYGDFFPENPKNIDELLEAFARRMAAMQAMLNSMTPEQRAQLQQLSDQLLGDMDLRWQMDQLGSNLRAADAVDGVGLVLRLLRRRPARHGRGDAGHGRARRPRPARVVAARRHVADALWPKPTWTRSGTCSATTRCGRCVASPS